MLWRVLHDERDSEATVRNRAYCMWSKYENGAWRDGAGHRLPTAPMQGSDSSCVPLVLAEEAWLEYDAQGHGSQSLERLNERGGFGDFEIMMLLYDRITRLQKQLSETTAAGKSAVNEVKK